MIDRKRIGLREVRALAPGEIVWDGGTGAVAGFGARRQHGPAVTYFVKYRTAEGRQRWQVIGRHGSPWTPDEARDRARRLITMVKDGLDPAARKEAVRGADTVAELCDVYLADAEAGRVLTRSKEPKKASTLAVDKGRVERHIKPLLGSLAVTAVTRDDIESLLHDIAEGRTAGKTKTAKKRGLARVTGGRTAATRAVGLLGAIFTYAVRKRMRPDNPVRGVERYADKERERRLSNDEYAALGAALHRCEAEGMWPPAVAAAWFLAFTGWRSSEAVGLQRPEVDVARRTAYLPDTKSGRSIRPLASAACEVLKPILQRGENRLFPATRGTADTFLQFKKFWPRIAGLGGLPADVTPHTLRHSFISLAADLGFSDSTIAALVGHRGQSVTSRYVHSADAVLLAAADAVANRTAELLGEMTHRPTAVSFQADSVAASPGLERHAVR